MFDNKRKYDDTHVDTWDAFVHEIQQHVLRDVEDWCDLIQRVYKKDERTSIITGVRHYVAQHTTAATRTTLFTHTLPFITRLLRDLPASFQHHNVIKALDHDQQRTATLTQRQCATLLAAAWWDLHPFKKAASGKETHHTVNFKVSEPFVQACTDMFACFTMIVAMCAM